MTETKAVHTDGENLNKEETLKFLRERREKLEVDLDRYLAMDLNDLADMVSSEMKAIDEMIALGTV